jgi:hypothetical protein
MKHRVKHLISSTVDWCGRCRLGMSQAVGCPIKTSGTGCLVLRQSELLAPRAQLQPLTPRLSL